MEWFFGFKKFLNKKIVLPPNQNDDLVVFYKLKNNMLKINSKAEVLEGYNLVTVHYNKVCDVLPQGDYELDATTVPALLKYCEKQSSNKGVFIPTRVFADLYFFNTNKKANYTFKTPNYILTQGQQGKVKIKLQGSFKMQVVNVKRFMQSFCDSYSIVKNKNILKDLSYYVGRVAEKSLDKLSYVLSDFLGNKDKVVDAIMQNIASLEKDLGVKIEYLSIEDVIVPRRYKLSKGFLQDSKNALDNSEYLLKLVEDRLNNLQEDMSVVFAGSKSENSAEFNAENQTQFSHNNSNQSPVNNFEKQSESTFVQPETANNYNDNEANYSNFGDQQAPNIIFGEQITEDEKIEKKELKTNDDEQIDKKENSRKENENLQKSENSGGKTLSSQEETKETNSSLVTCPCCGAKNFDGAEFCCVCKSKL